MSWLQTMHELFPAHTYMCYPETAAASTVEIPPVPLVWAEAYQGQVFFPPLLGVQERPANTMQAQGSAE